MGEMGDIGRRLGTVFIFTGVGALIGPPISGAINRATGGVQAVSYYAGKDARFSAIFSVSGVQIWMSVWKSL